MATSKDNKISLIVKNKSLDYGLLIVVLVLLAIGLVTVLSASAHYSLRTEGDSYFYVKKQLLFAVVGIISMLIISRIDYRILNSRISYVLLGIAFVMLCLVFVPGIGVTRNDATRWINLAGFQFQPSEIMKVAMIFFIATTISKNPKKIKQFWAGFVPYLVLIGAIAVLLLLEPHMSATIIIAVIAIAMIFVAGAKFSHLIPIGLVGVIGAIVLAYTSEYRWKRVMIFLDPWQDARGDGYQIIQSLYAIGSGGLFGVGLGKSVQKYLYIPEPHNDFIFAIWSEEMGLFGVILVILLFGIFIWRGITIALKAPDMFGSLVATGVTVMIGIQAIFSIAVVSSSMPVTGIPLPFFSYGGTALVILLSCVGILLSVSRQSRK
ncbi:MAG: putative lipid II flippase FtsW [Clostridia bacterium]|nr:putative lipid II flippase FtsW [Clostridia bacterium]